MSNTIRKPRTIALALAFLCASLPTSLHAQKQPYQPTSPKPPLLLSAKTVFISNDTAALMADSDKIFDELNSSIRTQGHFTIVPNPADADLILQYSFSYAGGAPNAVTLRVIDRKTLIILWSVSDQGAVDSINGGKKNKYNIIDEINDYLRIISTPQPSTN